MSTNKSTTNQEKEQEKEFASLPNKTIIRMLRNPRQSVYAVSSKKEDGGEK